MSYEFILAASWVTLKLALVSTVLLLALGAPLAWWLSRTSSRAKPYIEAAIALPLVLPPTVIGFYLLLAFAPQAWFGGLWQGATGQQLAFTFPALVIGSFIYSLPFVVQPLQSTFAAIPDKLLEASRTMGCGAIDRFSNVILPLAKNGLLVAASLGFAHTIGEFGVVLMIGGNIPGETQVLSIALYDQVEALNYGQAHLIALILVLVSLALLVSVYSKRSRRPGEATWF